MATYVELTNTVTDDLEASLSLSNHRTHKFTEPELSADNAPMLAVFPNVERAPMLATEDVVAAHPTLRIIWAEPSEAVVGSSEERQGRAEIALGTAQSIRDHLLTYATSLPDPHGNVYATVEIVRLGNERGGIWRAQFDLAVEELV